MTDFLRSSARSADGGLSAKQRSLSFTELWEVGITSVLGAESPVDVESDVDLEQPVVHEGTSWVDCDSGDSMAVNTDKAGLTWADKVSNVTLPLSGPLGDDGVPVMDAVNQDKLATTATTATSMAATSTMPAVTVDIATVPNNSGEDTLLSSSKGQSLNHRAEVPPIFLAYKRVCAKGQKLPLVQVATSVIQAMGTHAKLDAIQPMRTGWNIYMCTLLDQTHLIKKGIHIAGKPCLWKNWKLVGL